MFKGIAAQILIALTLTVALPVAVEAQQSARIGVSVRVVSSAVPETEAATTAELSRLAEIGDNGANVVGHSLATERGLAQIITEKLQDGTVPVAQLDPTVTREGTHPNPARVMITVAFTAN